jgi:hypothetical protein
MEEVADEAASDFRRVAPLCAKKLSIFDEYPTKSRGFFGAKVMSLEQMDSGDVIFVECRDDVRIMARIPGTFSLADRWDMYGDRRVFRCRAVNLSPDWVALTSPVRVKVGERVIAQIDHLGKLEGAVISVLEHGFMMSIANNNNRDNFAAKLEWLEKHKNHDASERRAAPREMPTDLYSDLILPDGRRETCRVLDISVSGAAISAATVPEIGTVVTIGTVLGRVVRHVKGGFAVRFTARPVATRQH